MQQINLLTQLPKPVTDYSSFKWMSLALGTLMGLLLLVSLFDGWHYYRMSQQRDQLKQTEVQQAARLMAYTKAHPDAVKNPLLEQQVLQLAGSIDEKSALIEVLTAGSGKNISGFSPFLKAIASAAPADLWLTRFDINRGGEDIMLMGQAQEMKLVPNFVDTLMAQSVFSARHFRVSKLEKASEANAHTVFVIESEKEA